MALHADSIYFIGSPTDIFVRYNCGGKLKFSIILNKRTYFLNYVWFTCKYFVLKFGKKNIYICLVSRIVLRISQWFLEVIYVYLNLCMTSYILLYIFSNTLLPMCTVNSACWHVVANWINIQGHLHTFATPGMSSQL